MNQDVAHLISQGVPRCTAYRWVKNGYVNKKTHQNSENSLNQPVIIEILKIIQEQQKTINTISLQVANSVQEMKNFVPKLGLGKNHKKSWREDDIYHQDNKDTSLNLQNNASYENSCSNGETKNETSEINETNPKKEEEKRKVTQKKKEEEKKGKNISKICKKKQNSYPEDFLHFYHSYPKREGDNKVKAFLAYKKAKKEPSFNQDALMQAVYNYQNTESVKKGFQKGIAVFLNQKMWEEEHLQNPVNLDQENMQQLIKSCWYKNKNSPDLLEADMQILINKHIPYQKVAELAQKYNW